MWTYIGQIVNFLIFVIILYYLLYKPVGRVMKKRRDEMEAERRQAEKKLEEAEKLRTEAEKAARELENQREAVLKEAREQAEAWRKELLAQAEEQARERLERFRRIMEQERGDLLDDISDELRDTIVKVAGSVLGDVSGGLIDRALDRIEALLDGLSEEQVKGARKALQESGSPVPVRFVGTVNDDQLDRLRATLCKKLDLKDIELEMTEDPALLAGLEVTLGHVQLEAHWRGVIDEALKQQHKTAAEQEQKKKA